MTEIPDWLNSTLASDAAGGAGFVDGIRPLREGQLVTGRASTVLVTEGDNQQLREAIAAGPGEGDILVVAGSPSSTGAVIGDLMGRWIENRGFRAIIIDGRVRDVGELRTLRLQIWARGVTPIAGGKRGGGRVGGPVEIAGVSIAPGDLIVADDDGVVVWPAARIDELLGKAAERLRSDQERLAVLAGGGDLA